MTSDRRPAAGADVLRVLRRSFWLGAFGLLATAGTFAGLDLAHRQSANWVRESREVGRLARNARAFALERVSGLRGLMLGREVAGIAPEIAAHRALKPTLDSLHRLTAHHPAQQARVDDIRAAIARWDSVYAGPTLRRLRTGFALDTSLTPAGELGNDVYEPVRLAFAAFVEAEEQHYRDRLATTKRLEWLATFAVLLELLLLMGVLAYLIRKATRQTKSLILQQHQLEEQAVELELQAADLQDQAMELEHQVDEAQELTAQLEETQESLQAAASASNAARRAEAAARNELLGVLSRMTDGIIALDSEWRLVYQNEAAACMTNRAMGVGIGEVIWETRPDLVGSIVEQSLRQAMETQRPVRFEKQWADGRKVGEWLEVHAYPSPDGLSIFLRDITAQRSLEAQFRQAQKMEAVGQLAGGIAHDFNNLLTAIRSYSELLLEDLEPGGTAHSDVLEIRGAADRAAALTRQLLAYSRKEVIQPAVLDLVEVAEGVGGMLQRLIGPEIELVTRGAAMPWAVLADPGQVEQVIVNLVVNARDAMPKGGRLSIEIGNRRLQPGDFPWVHASRDFVTLAVTDSGIGMTEETRSRIFDPFFTTKESGKGTGLGLSTVHGIVKQCGGGITVESAIGKGSTFTAYFPRHDQPAQVPSDANRPEVMTPTRSDGAGRLVLVIDDEPSICSAVSRVLTRQGYRILVAETPDQARVIAAGHVAAIDLILADLMVPGINGRDLVDEILVMQPQARVIFMSGFSDDAVKVQGIIDQGTPFIPKPFALEALVRKVRETLATAVAPPLPRRRRLTPRSNAGVK